MDLSHATRKAREPDGVDRLEPVTTLSLRGTYGPRLLGLQFTGKPANTPTA